MASEEGPVARANAGRLERALSNLVDNALRHGAGDVELGAEARDGHVSIWVIDHGHGMDDAFRARAHEPFQARVDRPVTGRSRARPGVQAIVSEHQGTMTIENRAGGNGTIATIMIPGPRAR